MALCRVQAQSCRGLGRDTVLCLKLSPGHDAIFFVSRPGPCLVSCSPVTIHLNVLGHALSQLPACHNTPQCIAIQNPQQPALQTSACNDTTKCIVTCSLPNCTPYVAIHLNPNNLMLQYNSPATAHQNGYDTIQFLLYRDPVWVVAQISFCTVFFSFFFHTLFFFIFFQLLENHPKKKKYIYIYIYIYIYSFLFWTILSKTSLKTSCSNTNLSVQP